MVKDAEITKHWYSIKKHILKRWDKLNADEVEQTKGRMDQLKRLVESHYGHSDRFEYDYQNICEEHHHTSLTKEDEKTNDSLSPHRSSNMVDGWKEGNVIFPERQNSKNSEASDENPGTDSKSGYQNLDTNSEKNDINPADQINTKKSEDFLKTDEENNLDSSYRDTSDEYRTNQDPSLRVMDTSSRGLISSASNSSAQNAAYYLFGDHSRSTWKL